MSMTAFQENPFYILSVSILDNKETVMEAAEDCAFDDPDREEDFEKAKNALINPKLRISAEIRWFPGLDRQQEKAIVQAIPTATICTTKLGNPLAQLNMEWYQIGKQRQKDLPEAIRHIGRLYEQVRSEAVQSELNALRAAAHYPEISDPSAVQAALDSLSGDIEHSIHEIVKAMEFRDYTVLANQLAGHIKKRHDAIISRFFSDYEMDRQEWIKANTVDILKLNDKIRENPQARDLATLEEKVAAWSAVCRPLACYKQSMGLEDTIADSLLWELRGTYIDLYNEQQERDMSHAILKLVENYLDFAWKSKEQSRQKIQEDLDFWQERAEAANVSAAFSEALDAFTDMIDTMNQELFFEDGHDQAIRDFYQHIFTRNYAPSIKNFLERDGMSAQEQQILYEDAACLYLQMGRSITWTNDFALAHSLAITGMKYARKGNDADIVADMQKLLDATAVPETPPVHETSSSPAHSQPTKKSDKGGGCGTLIFFCIIGACIGGPPGILAGLVLYGIIYSD